MMTYNIKDIHLEQTGNCYKYDTAANDYINLITSKTNIIEGLTTEEIYDGNQLTIINERTEPLEDVLFDAVLEASHQEITDAVVASLIHKTAKMFEASLSLTKSGYTSIVPAAEKKGISKEDMSKLHKNYKALLSALEKANSTLKRLNSKKDNLASTSAYIANGMNKEGTTVKQANKEITDMSKNINRWILQMWFGVKKKTVKQGTLDYGKKLITDIKKMTPKG